MSDLQASGIEQLMKHLEFLDEDLQKELLGMSLGSGPEAQLVTWLSQNIDSRNILTPEQLAEYEELGDEVLVGEELDRKFKEIFPESEWYELQDDDDITLEVWDQVDSHIDMISQLESLLRNKIDRLGLLDLEEKEIKVNMICLKKDCQHLDKELSCIYSDLNDCLKSFAKIPSRYLATNRVSTVVEMYKKHHKKFDKYLKMFIKRAFEDISLKQSDQQLSDCWTIADVGVKLSSKHVQAKPFTERLVNDRLEEISSCYLDIKVENYLLRAKIAGYEAAVNELKHIMEAAKGFKLMLSFSDMREEQLTKTLQLNGYELVQLIESYYGIMQDVTAMETDKVTQAKTAYRVNQQHCILKYADVLDSVINARLQTVDLFLLTLTVEKQRLTDVVDLLTEVPKDVIEKYNAAVARVETMRRLAANNNSEPVKHPLIQCLSRLYLGKEATDLSTLISCSRSLNAEIKQLEQNLFSDSLKSQRAAYLNNYFAVNAADRLLCCGLTKKPQIESLRLSMQYSELEELIKMFRNRINQLKSEVKKRQVFHVRNPMHAERRLLWTYFVMDPKQFMAKIAKAVEMADVKQRENKTTVYHRSVLSLLTPKLERM